jgi:uncharacterized protein YvpB
MRRRPWIPVLAGAITVLATALSPIAATSARAQDANADVTAWIEISSTRPAVGCNVVFGVEIRDQGNAVTDTRVAAALFSGSDPIDIDRDITDSDGVVHLTVDASDGSGDWVDINVNGSFLTGFSIAAGKGDSCDDSPRSVEVKGNVPVGGASADESSSDTTADDSSDDAAYYSSSDETPSSWIDVPFYKQERNLSCEYAAIQIATAYWGNTVSEYSLDDIVGWSDNPHWGYRGDITGWWGNTTDYGVYAEPLASAISQFGFYGDVFYAQGDASELTWRIDSGIPTLVFLAFWGDQSIYETTDDGTTYKVVAGEHVLVAYGYNDDGVFMSDPATAGVKFMDWGSFMAAWNVMDGMGLGVSPA